MPQIHRPKGSGAQLQPTPGDGFFSRTQPPAEDSHHNHFVKDLQWNASHQWIQLHGPVTQGVEGKEKVKNV